MDVNTCLLLLKSNDNSDSNDRNVISKRMNAFITVMHSITSLNNVTTKSDTTLSWQLEWINALNSIDLNMIINTNNINDIDDDIIQSILLLSSSLSKHNNNNNNIIIFFNNNIITNIIRSLILSWDSYKNPDIIMWQSISRLSQYLPIIFIEKQQIYDKLIILLNIELKNIIDSNNDNLWNSNTNTKFRRKLQNLVNIINNFYQKSDYCLTCIINHSITNIFQMIIRLERGYVQEFKEINKDKRYYDQYFNGVDINDTNNIIEKTKAQFCTEKNWTERCLTTLMNILGNGLAKLPKCSAVITLSDACAMLVSPCWQYQLISLKFIYAFLELDSLENQASSIRFDDEDGGKEEAVTNPNAQSSKSVSSRKKDVVNTTDKRKSISSKDKIEQKKRTNSVSSRRPGKAASTPVLMELCRSGFLRTLCWTALHSQIVIREEAGQILRFIIQTAMLDQNSEFWVSIVEQGLVPLLEIVSNGIYISGPNNAIPFPEVSIRDCAEEILRNLTSVLSNSSSFQGRIMNALVHTGSTKLRGNIFAGLIYLCARSTTLGKQLWAISGNKVGVISQTSGGDMFLELCEAAYKDPSELLTIIKCMCHVTKASSERKALIELQTNQSSIGLQENKNSHVGPTVLVSNEGQMIKMQCPSPALIAKHSLELANLLQNSLDEDKHINLNGNYYVWQEVLSHITNDLFLEDNRVNRLSLDELIESLNIAYHYNMSKLLEKYSQLLSKRLTLDTFVPIFKCVLGIGNKMKKNKSKYMYHLSLGHDCLRFLSNNIDKMLNQRFPARVSETIELLHTCLENLFFRNDDDI